MGFSKHKILIVIVLYNTKLEDSLSYKSLNDSLSDDKQVVFEKIIFNNSANITIGEIEGVEVVNSPENIKLNGAYNYCLEHANKIGANWMLLLDQDTKLTRTYFEKMVQFLVSNDDDEVVSVVPRLRSGGYHISPHQLCLFQSMRKDIVLPASYSKHLVALNSVSLHRISFLNQIGGFSSQFSLDLLDYWVSYMIFKSKKKIHLLDATLSHDLSVVDFEKNMSVERYKGLLIAEKQYIKHFGLVENFFFRLRLFYRYIKQRIRFNNKEYSIWTLYSILNKI